MNLEDVVRIGELLDNYGNLLSERPRMCMEKYYYNDLSLAEIANDLSVSRQAVHDNLQRAIEQLERYEEELKILRRREERQRAAAALLSRMSAEERRKYADDVAALAE